MDMTGRITQARLIARELWSLMREDASHRLGIAQAFPQADDKTWTPEFYRQCQLAERLFAILDELAAQGAAVVNGGNAAERKDTTRPTRVEQVTPHAPAASRGRFGV